MGGVEVQFHSILTLALQGGVQAASCPGCCTPCKQLTVPTEVTLCQFHSWSQHCAEEKNLLPQLWFKPQGHPPCSQVAILTILSWLPWEHHIKSYSSAHDFPAKCWHFQLDQESMTSSKLYSIIHYSGRTSIYMWTRGLSKWLVSTATLFQLRSKWPRLGSTIF